MKNVIRSVGVASVAVAFGAGAALSAPVAGAQSSLPGGSLGSDNCGEQIVTPSTLAASGWSTPSDETPATIEAVEATEDVGEAALVFGEQDEDTPGVSMYKDAGGMDLADLLSEDDELLLNFDYTTEGQAPAMQIRLLDASVQGNDGDAKGFATITWSPDAGTGDWQSADASESEQFWVTRPVVNESGEVVLPRGERTTLADIIEKNPEATITGVGVQKTRENAAESVAIDNFVFGCETTNFELDPDGGSLENIFGSVSGIFES